MNTDMTIHAIRAWVTMSQATDRLSPSNDKNMLENRQLHANRHLVESAPSCAMTSRRKPHSCEFVHGVSVLLTCSIARALIGGARVPRRADRGASAVTWVLS